MQKTIWKPVVGYEGIYEVSDRFYVRKVERKKVNKVGVTTIYPFKEVSIYNHGDKDYFVSLRKDGKTRQIKLVKVVADAFITNPNPAEFDMVTVNGEYKYFADMRLEMLEWVNRSIIQERRYRAAGVNSFSEGLSTNFPGVYAERRNGMETGKYIAKVRFKGDKGQKVVGRFNSPEEAKTTRDRYIKNRKLDGQIGTKH
jgi:hypothetical protein